VDDDPQLREILAEFLRDQGHSVDVADDGRGALQRLRPGAYDVAFVDYAMPGMSGLDLLRAARERVPDTALVMMTGFTSVDVAVEAIRSGASEFMAKPLEPAALDRVLESVKRATRTHEPPQETPADRGEPLPGPQVRAVFLTDRAGLLLASRVAPGERMVDRDLFGATLDVIQNFMRTSFPALRGGWLKTIRQGDRTLVLEPGEESLLTVLIQGDETEDLRAAMRSALRDFETQNRGRFRSAPVYPEDFRGTEELLSRLAAATNPSLGRRQAPTDGSQPQSEGP